MRRRKVELRAQAANDVKPDIDQYLIRLLV